MAAYITVGAKTSRGGTVISGSPYTTHNGIPVCRVGDKVLCKTCKKVVTIATGDPSYIVDGSPIARHGDITTCGSKLIAIQHSFAESDFEVMGVEQAEEIKREAQRYFNEAMGSELYDEQFQVLDENDEPMSNLEYQIIDAETQEVLHRGTTNTSGSTERVSTQTEKKIEIIFI